MDPNVLERPPYTMIHNYVLDHIMRDLSPNAWKVLCWAIRQTQGWIDPTSPTGRKESDVISYSQFLAATGIVGRSTLSSAINECRDKGYLIREAAGTNRGRTIYAYRLNTSYSVPGEETPISRVLKLDSAAEATVLKSDQSQGGRVLKLDPLESNFGTVTGPKTGLTKETNKLQTNVDVAVTTTLMRNGLTSAQAERWAQAVPLELIEANVAYLDTPQAKGIHSRAAYLISQFKKRSYPPQVSKPKDEGIHRFVESKYADQIEY